MITTARPEKSVEVVMFEEISGCQGPQPSQSSQAYLYWLGEHRLSNWLGGRLVQTQHLPAHHLLLLLALLHLPAQSGQLGLALAVGGVEPVDSPQYSDGLVQLTFLQQNLGFSEQGLLIVWLNLQHLQ